MKKDYIPIVLCGLVGFAVGGYIGLNALIPKSSGLHDEFIMVFAICSIGLFIGSLAGFTVVQIYKGDA
jgi:hypothetical protein|tara:strand:- start:4476 stop:4679 length:204 start_codon:yes stop_codon:yes gene_type:complete